MKIKKRWILSLILLVALITPLVIIQSSFFARKLTDFARKHILSEIGIDGGFSALSIKLFPPGVVIHDPSITLKDKNPVELPAGTRVKAKNIEATFELFQLVTGLVTIKGVMVNGAVLDLNLDAKFLRERQKRIAEKPSRSIKKLSWESMFDFNFRSVGIADSSMNLKFATAPDTKENKVFSISTFAKELTVGKGTRKELQTYDVGMDFGETVVTLDKSQIKLTQMKGNCELSSQGLSLRSLSLQDSSRYVSLDGTILGNLLEPKDLKSELHYVVRGPIENWIGDPNLKQFFTIPVEKYNGMIKLEGNAKANLMNIRDTFEAKSEIELTDFYAIGWKTEEARFKINWNSPNITLESADIRFGTGNVRLESIQFDTNSMKNGLVSGVFKPKITLSNVDLHRVAAPILDAIYALKMNLSGEIPATVTLSQASKSSPVKFAATIDPHLNIRNFSFDNQKLNVKKPLQVLLGTEQADVRASVAIDESGVTIQNADVVLPNTKLKASGKINGQSGLDLDIKGGINLKDIGKIANVEIEGQGDLHWTIKGPGNALIFTFDADIDSARYLNLNFGKANGRVVYDDGKEYLYFQDFKGTQGRLNYVGNGYIDLGNTNKIDIGVKVSQGTIQDFAKLFGRFIEKAVPWYPADLTGQMTGNIRVSGKADTPELVVMGDMDLVNVEYNYELFKSGKLRAGYVKGALVAESLELTKKSGVIKGNITFGADEVLSYKLMAENFTTLDFDRLALLDIPYRAPIKFTSKGEGKIESLKSSTTFEIGAGNVKNYRVPGSSMSIETANGRMNLKADLFEGRGSCTLDYGWKEGSPSSFTGGSKGLNLLPILVVLNPTIADQPNVYSEVTGNTVMNFKTGSFSRLNGEFNLDSYSINRHDGSIILSSPVKIAIKDGNYHFERVRFKGDNTDLYLSGGVNAGNINYDLVGKLNMKLIELIVSEMEALNGVADINASLRGRVEKPSFKASIDVQEAELRLRSLAQPFEKLRLKVRIDDSIFSVSELNAKFAGGRVSGGGGGELYLTQAPSLDLNMNLENPKIKVYPVEYARVNGKLTLKGEKLPYKVKGRVNIAEALAKDAILQGTGAGATKSSKFLPQNINGSGSELSLFDLDVDLHADNGIMIKNSLIDAEVKGDLKIIKSIKTPKILGNVNVMTGKILFKDNFFNIQSGNVKFTDPSVIDPEFDIAASTETKGYKVNMVAVGKSSNYDLNFQSQPPLSQNDIVNLLTLGVTSSEYQNIARGNREAYTRDEMYGLIFNQSSINKGLQEKFGVKLQLDQSQTSGPESVFRAQSTEVSSNAAPKVVIQKQVTKNLNAKAGSTVGAGESRQQSVDLEYNVGKNLSVIGTYEDQRGAQPQNSRTSVGADLKYKLKFK